MPTNPLDTAMVENDAMATTVRGYFKRLLVALLTEKEEFSGKRPFGNSGWEYELYASMIKGDLIEGSLDEYGYVEEIDEEEADRLLLSYIHAM